MKQFDSQEARKMFAAYDHKIMDHCTPREAALAAADIFFHIRDFYAAQVIVAEERVAELENHAEVLQMLHKMASGIELLKLRSEQGLKEPGDDGA